MAPPDDMANEVQAQAQSLARRLLRKSLGGIGMVHLSPRAAGGPAANPASSSASPAAAQRGNTAVIAGLLVTGGIALILAGWLVVSRYRLSRGARGGRGSSSASSRAADLEAHPAVIRAFGQVREDPCHVPLALGSMSPAARTREAERRRMGRVRTNRMSRRARYPADDRPASDSGDSLSLPPVKRLSTFRIGEGGAAVAAAAAEDGRPHPPSPPGGGEGASPESAGPTSPSVAAGAPKPVTKPAPVLNVQRGNSGGEDVDADGGI